MLQVIRFVVWAVVVPFGSAQVFQFADFSPIRAAEFLSPRASTERSTISWRQDRRGHMHKEIDTVQREVHRDGWVKENHIHCEDGNCETQSAVARDCDHTKKKAKLEAAVTRFARMNDVLQLISSNLRPLNLRTPESPPGPLSLRPQAPPFLEVLQAELVPLSDVQPATMRGGHHKNSYKHARRPWQNGINDERAQILLVAVAVGAFASGIIAFIVVRRCFGGKVSAREAHLREFAVPLVSENSVVSSSCPGVAVPPVVSVFDEDQHVTTRAYLSLLYTAIGNVEQQTVTSDYLSCVYARAVV